MQNNVLADRRLIKIEVEAVKVNMDLAMIPKNSIPTISQKILCTNMLNQTMARRFSMQNPPMMHPN